MSVAGSVACAASSITTASNGATAHERAEASDGVRTEPAVFAPPRPPPSRRPVRSAARSPAPERVAQRRRRADDATPNRPGRGGDGVASLLLLASVNGEFAEETSALRVEHVEVDGRGRVIDASVRRGAPNLVAQALETRLKRRNFSRSRRVRVRGTGGRARGRRPVGRAATTTEIASRSTGVDHPSSPIAALADDPGDQVR